MTAKGPKYSVPFRRRREGKTDYRARRALILSKMPRIVARGSLKHMTVQVVNASDTSSLRREFSSRAYDLINEGYVREPKPW